MKGFRLIVAAVAALALAACASSGARPIPLSPGEPAARGYLAEAGPRGGWLLPPPPEAGSPLDVADLEAVRAARSGAGAARLRLAQADAEIDPRYAPQLFDCAVGARLTEGPEPAHDSALSRLFARTLADSVAAWDDARARWTRERPFLRGAGEPCLRVDAAARTASSYPSGHAVAGRLWALLLAELAPDRAEAVLARGRAVGESRVVCGLHHPTDVEAGRVVADALWAALQTSPDFRADLEAARAELADRRARAVPNPVCTAERAALAKG